MDMFFDGAVEQGFILIFLQSASRISCTMIQNEEL